MYVSLWTAGNTLSQSMCFEALREIVRSVDLQVTCETVDILARWRHALIPTFLSHKLASWMTNVSSLWGRDYAAVVSDMDKDREQSWPDQSSWNLLLDVSRARQELQQNPPVLVIACHPVASWLASQIRLPVLQQNPQHTFPVLSVVLSCHLHPSLWQPGLSRVALLHPELQALWQQQGIPSEKLLSLGLPWSTQPISRAEARQQLGGASASEKPVILVSMEGISWSAISLWLQRCCLFSSGYAWWFDYGTDDELAAFLRQEVPRWGMSAQMFGHRMAQRHLVYAAADLVILRSEPLSVLDVLSCHTPVLLWPPRPGPETEDGKFFQQYLGASVMQPEVMETSVDQALDFTAFPQPKISLTQESLTQEASAMPGLWQEVIRSMIDQREQILARDALLLPLEQHASWFQERADVESHGVPDRSSMAPTSTESASFFETIGNSAAGNEENVKRYGMKSKEAETRLRELATERELLRLKERMRIDRTKLDLSKLKEE